MIRRASDMVAQSLRTAKNSSGETYAEFEARAPKRLDGEPWTQSALRLAWATLTALELPSLSDASEAPEEASGGVSEWHAAMVRRGVPARICEVLEGELIPTQAMDAAKRWTRGTFLCLAGESGVGKSVAAGWLISRGPLGPCPFTTPQGHERTSYWPHAPRWIRSIDVARGFDDLPGEVRRASVLVIDDLGDEKNDEHSRARLSALLSERDDLKARTVITTNLNAATIQNRYGTRFTDRIKGHGFLVSLRGESLRKR